MKAIIEIEVEVEDEGQAYVIAHEVERHLDNSFNKCCSMFYNTID